MIDVQPSKKEVLEVSSLAKEIISKIKIKDAKAVLGGSGAKNTWLPGKKEIDIYVKFNYKKYKDKSEKLSDLVYPKLKKAFKKVTSLHGSRDYFQVFKDNFTIEIIPILDIKKADEAKNITDISQLHVDYVKKYAKLANEIRLAKTFAKAQEVYGAESYIRGFSGYVLELLVIQYGSFKKLINAASKWKEITAIGKKDDVATLNYSKKVSPLILIDPVQSTRNAAAALSDEMYNKFIAVCKSYSKKPSDEFFTPKKHSFKSDHNSILLEVKPKSGKQDVVGAKLLKAFEHIKRKLEENDFKIKDAKWHWNKIALFSYELESSVLDEFKEVRGPPVNLKHHLEEFEKKHGKIYTKNGISYAKVRRNFTHARNLIKSVFGTVDIINRVNTISIN